MQPVTGGASGALTYRVEASGRQYLLRLEPPQRSFADIERAYTCMRLAADADIAPPLRYVDATVGVAIMDFVNQRSLQAYPGGPQALARALGHLVARLQRTPAFPARGEYPVILAYMLQMLRSSGLFAAGLLDRHQAAFERIRGAYPWQASTPVSSHNDPNPRNILFDGERLWLIDWETSFRNDPLVDIAVLTHESCASPELSEVLLQAWLGHPPDSLIRTRLSLMTQLTRLFYAGLIFSGVAVSPPPMPITDLSAPTPAEFGAAVMEGRLKPGASETLYVLGKMCLAGFVAGVDEPGFERALEIVRTG